MSVNDGASARPHETVRNVLLLLEDIAHFNIVTSGTNGSPTTDKMFYSSYVPEIHFAEYGVDIWQKSGTEEAVAIAAACLVLRYQAVTSKVYAARPDDFLCPLNIHRLYLTASVVAAKMYPDNFPPNRWYGRMSGVCVEEMNDLETDFIETLNWSTMVSKAEHDGIIKLANDAAAYRLRVISGKEDSAGVSATPPVAFTEAAVSLQSLPFSYANTRRRIPAVRTAHTPQKAAGLWVAVRVMNGAVASGDPLMELVVPVRTFTEIVAAEKVQLEEEESAKMVQLQQDEILSPRGTGGLFARSSVSGAVSYRLTFDSATAFVRRRFAGHG